MIKTLHDSEQFLDSRFVTDIFARAVTEGTAVYRVVVDDDGLIHQDLIEDFRIPPDNSDGNFVQESSGNPARLTFSAVISWMRLAGKRALR